MTKTTKDERRSIIELYETKRFTMNRIAKMFGISKGRVSQLVNDNYAEQFKLVNSGSDEEE